MDQIEVTTSNKIYFWRQQHRPTQRAIHLPLIYPFVQTLPMEQMPAVAKLPHLMPPFYTLQANTARRRLAAARLQIFLLAAAAGEEFFILNYGNSVLDCGRDDVDRDRNERGGGAVQYEDVVVGTGGGVRRFFRRRLVEAEMCEGADEEVVGVGDYVEEESYGDDLGHFDGVEEETHFLDSVFQTAEGGGGGGEGNLTLRSMMEV